MIVSVIIVVIFNIYNSYNDKMTLRKCKNIPNCVFKGLTGTIYTDKQFNWVHLPLLSILSALLTI